MDAMKDRDAGRCSTDVDGQSAGRAHATRADYVGSPEETEAYQELLARASRKTGAIPAPLLVKQVLRATGDADWPVMREAMDALLRRRGFARRDELTIATRPEGRAVLGPYTTRRRRDSERPYSTVLRSLDPPLGSCDCPDFLRNSLGLCKHILVILEDIASKPRRFEKALHEQASSLGSTSGNGLIWNPVRPLTGDGDLLEQVCWLDGSRRRRRSGQRASCARRWFRSGNNGDLVLKSTFRDRPERRLELVKDLLRMLNSGRARRQQPGTGLDPALVVLLKQEKARLERLVHDTISSPRTRSLLRTLKKKLYPYQREGVEKFLSRGRLLLADDMGLGKTAQAVASCHALWKLRKVRRGLLIVPASLKPQWEREWQLFSDVPVETVDGAPSQRHEVFRSTRRGFLIINYEQLLRDLSVIHEWRPDLVVLDEAQRIKNWATKTATYVKKLEPTYRLVLTGTPMENRLEELASIFDWVDSFALEPKWRLVPWHAEYVDGRREIGGARNLDTLRLRLSGSMIRRVRKDVLKQLPPRTDTHVPVEFSDEQQEEHDALNQPIASILRRAESRPLTQAEFLRLMSLLTTQRIISNGLAQMRFEEVWPSISRITSPRPTMLKSLSSPKLIEFRELIRQIAVEQERKIVVFSQWRRMLHLARWAVQDILDDQGLHGVFFTGEERQKRRTQNIVDFHDDPRARIFFASDAGGVGLNLQRAANCCINLELPWNPAVLEQRIGRIYRIGQKNPIDVYNLISENCIECRIARIINTKQAFFSGLFDGTSDSIKFESSASFLSRLEKIMEPVVAPELETLEESEEDGAVEDVLAEKELDALVDAASEAVDSAPSDVEGRQDITEERMPGPARSDSKRQQATGKTTEPVSALFNELEVRKTEKGGLIIEAPPEAAASLASLFEGMASLLKAASRKS